MQNNCISIKSFADTGTIYSASKPIEIYMGGDTENVIDTLFDTILERIQQAIVTSQKMEANLLMKVLLYCIIISRK